MKKILCVLLLGVSSSAFADFAVNLDAGRLRGPAGLTALPSDNTSPSNAGGLLLLIAAGGDLTFSNTLTSGQYVSGNDILLAAGGFNMIIGTDETQTSFSITFTPATGDRIALRWFPDLTFAQFKLGATPSAGQSYGTYNPRTSNPANTTDNPDGGDSWLVPAGGTINLNFITTNSDPPPGTQPAALGFANFIVAVPEPSTFVGLAIGFAALLGFRARKRRLA